MLIKSDIHSIWSAASRLLEDDKKGINYLKSEKNIPEHICLVLLFIYITK